MLAHEDFQVLHRRGGAGQAQLGLGLLQQRLGDHLRVAGAGEKRRVCLDRALGVLEAETDRTQPEVHVLEIAGGAVAGFQLLQCREGFLVAGEAQQAHRPEIAGVRSGVRQGEAGQQLVVVFQGGDVVGGAVMPLRGKLQVLLRGCKEAASRRGEENQEDRNLHYASMIMRSGIIFNPGWSYCQL